jgi:steroid 5-alpha reductase family enzyme
MIVSTILVGAAALVLAMATLWLVQLRTGNASVVDPGWAGGIALLALVYALRAGGYPPRVWLLAAMVILWGARLGLYLLLTRVVGHPEEGRYVELRRQWKTNIPLKFLGFFQAQALLCVILSVPFAIAMDNSEADLSAWEWAGAAVWLVAFIGELLADSQLNAFKANAAHKGKTCRAGLWRYSRHPNYFFEFMIWMAFSLYATGSPHGYWAWVCPALMLYFLFRVTGIPATEAQALRTKGADYEEYQRTTSAFIPWFPKGDSAGAR